MKIIKQTSTDPYFNLATEQYILETMTEPTFMLWRNEPCVVIGRNQNAYGEINIEYTKEKNIKVSRRLTGGGAVFHDLGNVNFSFFDKSREENTLDFKGFTAPIIKALCDMGLNAELSGRNDITVNGYKVSGNAQCVYNGNILSHGCILYNADLSFVAGALNVDKEKLKSKGIDSVRSRVTNIADLLENPMSTVDFISYLESYVDGEIYTFTDREIAEINKLNAEKYATWDWIWGRSKEYSTVNKERFPFGSVEVSLSVNNGIINDISFTGDYFSFKDVSELEKSMLGIRYDYDEILKAVFDCGEYFSNSNPEQIAKLIYKNDGGNQ